MSVNQTPPLSLSAQLSAVVTSGDSGSDELQSARIRAEQIHAVMGFTPIAMVANCVNAALIDYVVLPIASPFAVALWSIALLAVVGVGARAWFRARGATRRTTASPRAIRRATFHGGILAAVWALVPILWFPVADSYAQLVIGTVMTGMICAGAFVLATVARAAVLYVVVMTIGAIIGLISSASPYAFVLIVLLLAYSTVVMRSALGTARLFANQFRSESALRERGQVIELLLAEFEENASDWLFELDANGVIIGHSARFTQVVGTRSADLVGASLTSLLSPESAQAFRKALARGLPFRELVVEADIDGEQRWWTLTAGPSEAGDTGPLSWRGVGSDITQTKTANDRTAFVARTDMLTGLSNRSAFRDAVADAIARRRSDDPPMAFGCLDLDQFKNVNDALGHLAGDTLLRMVASELVLFGEEEVEVGRLGGDEFGLLFRRCESRDDLVALSERIIAALSKTYEIDNERVTIGASIGLALGPRDGEDVDTLVRNADLALYRAKSMGGGVAVTYDVEMHKIVDDRRRLQEDLSLALARDELFLTYQPIVQIGSRRTVGFEALIRWRHPVKGVISPDLFIPVAERSGLIVPIGDWVLRTACRDAVNWPDDATVSINLSAVQISRSNVAASVVSALVESGLPARRLVLEITETLFVKQEAETSQFVLEMRALGASIALDDFGTGYSSLGYLGRLPIDKIKIDRSFISGTTSLEHRTAITQAIIGMAKGLGMTTTAEGIETEETYDWLRERGGDLGQGFLFARPMLAEEIPAYLAGAPGT